MELNQDKYLIKENSGVFAKYYEKIFNKEWYPKLFINDGYSMFFIKIPEHGIEYFKWNDYINFTKGSKFFFKSSDINLDDYYSESSDKESGFF